MKKSIAFLAFAFLTTLGFSQEIEIQDTNGNALTNVVEFGKIKEGVKAEHVVNIKNIGDKPLVIKKADASCGCTVPTIPNEPILPGQIGKLPIVYTSVYKLGLFTKAVTLYSNAVNKERLVLRVKGEVVAK